ncbi:MAG: hypothetical protein ACI9HK_000892 [Pirellulaceae bacterium]|jgi:hypothetical protein
MGVSGSAELHRQVSFRVGQCRFTFGAINDRVRIEFIKDTTSAHMLPIVFHISNYQHLARSLHPHILLAEIEAGTHGESQQKLVCLCRYCAAIVGDLTSIANYTNAIRRSRRRLCVDKQLIATP